MPTWQKRSSGGPGGLLTEGRAAMAAAPTLAGKAWEAVKPVLTGAVAPGLTSEAAGEATQGTALADGRRPVGGGIPAAASAYRSAPDRLMGRAVPAEARAAADAAQELQRQAAAAFQQ